MIREKKIKQTLFFGTLSIFMYIGLFANTETITDLFTRGGYYGIYPLITALMFSLVHGKFAANVLDVFNISPRLPMKSIQKKVIFKQGKKCLMK